MSSTAHSSYQDLLNRATLELTISAHNGQWGNQCCLSIDTPCILQLLSCWIQCKLDTDWQFYVFAIIWMIKHKMKLQFSTWSIAIHTMVKMLWSGIMFAHINSTTGWINISGLQYVVNFRGRVTSLLNNETLYEDPSQWYWIGRSV